MTYGGLDVLHEPMRFGSAAPGAGLRVVLARDGGFIQAKVGDTDGNPVSQAWVYVMPDGVPSSAALSAALVSGRTDQTGAFASGALRPGKYYVLASETEAFPTPESMDALWRARTRATEVELAPKGTAAVKLEPVTIE
ncbi:MAG: carboxypeptidase-like regulatory domain-containing protein [Acidobacteriia bacterium]|nr:carboxypeptidase-like regulatory domain-containing protein [Terriglobia bacterium]